jgi:hypothetical protein
MKESPGRSPRRQAERAAREARLAQALRDNLHRRKARARAQAGRIGDADVSAALSEEPLSSKSNRRGGETAD